eukprot:sb/3478574/
MYELRRAFFASCVYHASVSYSCSICTSAPIGCASSKGFLITHFRHFRINNTVAMATELVTMGLVWFGLVRLYVALRPEAFQLCAYKVFDEGAFCRLDTA